MLPLMISMVGNRSLEYLENAKNSCEDNEGRDEFGSPIDHLFRGIMAKGAKKKKANKGPVKDSQSIATPEKDNRGNELTEKKDKKAPPPRKFIPRLDDPHRIRKPITENLTNFQATFHCRECKIRYSNNVKPMSMTCGHSICDMCIEEHLGKNYQCKLCMKTNEITQYKYKVNHLLINIIDEIMDDTYLRVKVFDGFNARGIVPPPEVEDDEVIDPLTLMSFKAERRVDELDACKKLIADETTSDKPQKKILVSSEVSLSTLKDNLLSVDLTSIIKAVTDLHHSIKPIDMKLADYRQSMGRVCSLEENRKKFLRRFQDVGVELQFNLKVVKELHDGGYKMVVAIHKKSHSLWARLEWHEFGIHMNCFNTSKPDEATFYFEYKDILNSEYDGISHVWLDIASSLPKRLKEKDPYDICSFDLENARQSNLAVLVEEDEPAPQVTTDDSADATVVTTSSDPKPVTDSTPERTTKIVKKAVPCWRQRVYFNLAETCYASHFAEFALGKDKVSYKDWNLKLEKSGPSLVSVGTDGCPPSLSCQYTSLHPNRYLFPEQSGNVYACNSDMRSGTFKILLDDMNSDSSLIGSVHSGLDYLNQIETYANIKECGVVLKFK